MTTVLVPLGRLHDLVERAFIAHGVAEKAAGLLAATVTAAERDGSPGHGLFRLPGYFESLACGYVDGQAEPLIERPRPGVILIDGRRGFAQVSLAAAAPMLMDAARQCGIACAAIRNAHHYAGLSHDVEPFAEQGFFALAIVNGRARVAPWGATRPVVGTNPFAFACPRAEGAPLVWDMATSAIANAEVLLAARDGHAIPAGVALDAAGAPTTSARAVLEGGSLLPFGGHKGAAIAVMIELLGAALTGARFGFEEGREAPPNGRTSNTGQFVILIDPASKDALNRVETLLDELKNAGASRLPGERRLAARRAAEACGIAVAEASLSILQSDKWK